MLTKYIHEAMKLAKYKILEDGSYYGDIPGFRGVLANADNLEECRDELQDTLEEWILLGIRLGHNLPEANGIRLVTETA
ncbi:MAG: type II toxin-antitoxin system HicB family antitoxin [Anaerolineales bacterium]